jgi:hypothetical protein
MRVLASLERPAVVQKVLTHVDLPTEPSCRPTWPPAA